MKDTQTQIPAELRNRNLGRVIALTRWPDFHDYPSVAGLRWLVFNSKHNGFSNVIGRAGRRILIDEAEYFRYLKDGRNFGRRQS